MNTRNSFLLFALFFPLCVFAYQSVVAKPEDARIVLPLGEAGESQEFFGWLDDFPHTYTFEVKETIPFKAVVSVPDEPHIKNDVSVMIVKKERRGVSEISRTNVKEAPWKPYRSVLYAEHFREGGTLGGSLESGSYILEVSAPNNDGKYRLNWGEERVKRGYFAHVHALFEVKAFLNHSKFSAVLSPLLFVPLLIIGALAWWFYKKRKHRALAV